MKKNGALIMLTAVAALSFESCKKDLFDQQIYNEVITQTFPIDPIDANHLWSLSTRRTVTIRVNANIEHMESVMVLTDDPTVQTNAQIMAETKHPEEGTSYTLLFSAPEAQTTFYAAIKTADNYYAVKSFTTSANTVDFTEQSVTKVVNELAYQSFTYCFEENFPLPGDYDFNDCVIRLGVRPGDNQNQIKMEVTLAAVGAKMPIAAAVRIKNYHYDEIESVEIEEGTTFDDGYPLTPRYIPNTSTYQSGGNNEPVIRLFEDAMWCMVKEDPSDNGVLKRYLVNVSRKSDDDNKIVSPVTRTFVITFKKTATTLLNNLLTDYLDPFIITNYNNTYWETHTYQDQMAQVLYNYPDQNKLHMTWALAIPTGTFRWPLEGLIIGNYKDGLLSGAFREYGHSFGQWAADQNTSKDWFYHPAENEVYK